MARAALGLATVLPVLLAVLTLAPLPAPAADDVEIAAYKRAVEQRFAQWLEAVWPDAQAAGVSRATFEANLKGLKLNWSLPQLVLPDPAGPAVRACRNRWRKPRHRNTRQNSTPRSSISRMAHSPHSRPRAAPRSANWARPSPPSRKNTTCRQASSSRSGEGDRVRQDRRPIRRDQHACDPSLHGAAAR